MPLPSIIVEIAFASNTYATSPTWTDVSAYAMEVSTDRGRSTQLDQFNAGKASVKFKNLDGRFNPGNTAGAYYPNVLPNKQVRIRETANGNLFYGFIEPQGWDLSWNGPRYGEATMRAEDGLARLARYQLTQVADGSYQHDGTGQRIGRALDDAGWPAAWRDIDTGIATLQGTNFANEAALTHIQAVALTEGSNAVYVDTAGLLVFDSRHAVLSDSRMTASQCTFTDDGGATIPFLVDSVNPVYGRQLYNTVRARKSDSDVIYESTDATSVTANGEMTLDRQGLLWDTEPQAESLPDWLLAQYKDPYQEIDSLDIKPMKSATTLTHAVTRKLRDRVIVEFRPPGEAAQRTFNAFIERISHRITRADWTTTFGFSSADRYGFANYAEFLELDHATRGLLNTAKLAY